MPAVLVRSHAPFVIGNSAENALENSVVLEEIAEMCFKSLMLNKKIKFDNKLLEKHFKRKHGQRILWTKSIIFTNF